MPSKSKAQQRFFGVVRGIQKGTGKGKGKAKKAAKDMDAKDVEDFASTKHKGLPNRVKQETKVRNLIRKMVREIMSEDFAGAHPKEKRDAFNKMREEQSEVLGYKLMGVSDVKSEIGDATVHEATKRDYKAEYKKYGSSKKAKKYRAELNKYNRQKGTYGNGDKKDASHKGGKIVGFEEQSKNRGRREKSRLKKENTIKLMDLINEAQPYETILQQLGGNKFIAMTGAKNLGTSTKKDLSFSIGRNSKGVTHVIIKLTSMDLYDMEFINMRGPKRKVIKKVKGVYADMLQKIFTKYTGLRTRL